MRGTRAIHRALAAQARPQSTVLLVGLWTLALAAPVIGQDEFHDHVAIYSTEDGGGQLTTDYDFEVKRPPLFFSGICFTEDECLYSSINPAFLTALPEGEEPNPELHPVKDGVPVSLEVVAIAAGLSLNLGGPVEDSVLLGTSPFHTHPSWQLVVPEGEIGDYDISFKLTTTADDYEDSDVYTLSLTNQAPVVATPTPEATPTPTVAGSNGCTGDCNQDGIVSVDELVRAVMIMLGELPLSDCEALDVDGDEVLSLDELVMAVEASLGSCSRVTLARLQDEIFTPTCATPFCHSAELHSNDLSLAVGDSYAQLVNVDPNNVAAKSQGYVRVDPKHPDNSYLLLKLLNPPPILGSRMPLSLPPLPAAQIDLVRRWIAQGAKP